jgi:hypothetical protein
MVFPLDFARMRPAAAPCFTAWCWVRAWRCSGGIAEVVLASDIGAAAGWGAALLCGELREEIANNAAIATPLDRCFIRWTPM